MPDTCPMRLNGCTALDAANVKLTQMVVWLEANQPDVFKRGIWDSLK